MTKTALEDVQASAQTIIRFDEFERISLVCIYLECILDVNLSFKNVLEYKRIQFRVEQLN